MPRLAYFDTVYGKDIGIVADVPRVDMVTIAPFVAGRFVVLIPGIGTGFCASSILMPSRIT